MGENRAFLGDELPAARLVDHGAREISGEQVRRELDTLEPRRDRRGQGAHGQGLGQARHAFEQYVPIGQQADQEAFDHVLLADDHLADLRDQPVDEDALLVDPVVDDLDVVRCIRVVCGHVHPSVGA